MRWWLAAPEAAAPALGAGPAGTEQNNNSNAPISTREGGDAGPATTTSSSTQHDMKKHSKAKKPMTDTTNTPGANASSDTKGQ